MITHTPNGRRLINCPPSINPDRYHKFAREVAIRESSGYYGAVNPSGYLGAYQFGLARLSDYGFTERRPSTAPTDCGNRAFRWVAPWYAERLLRSDSLQDRLFALHVSDHLAWVARKGLDRYVGEQVSALFVDPATAASLIDPADDTTITRSGMVGVLHLVGYGGLLDLCAGKRDRIDGNGTSASEYLKLFGGWF